MAVHSLQKAFTSLRGVEGKVCCWSASDVSPLARRVLLHKAVANLKNSKKQNKHKQNKKAVANPMHVFETSST